MMSMMNDDGPLVMINMRMTHVILNMNRSSNIKIDDAYGKNDNEKVIPEIVLTAVTH